MLRQRFVLQIIHFWQTDLFSDLETYVTFPRVLEGILNLAR